MRERGQDYRKLKIPGEKEEEEVVVEKTEAPVPPPLDHEDDGFGSDDEAGAPAPAPAAFVPEDFVVDEETKARANEEGRRACIKVAAFAVIDPILKAAVAGCKMMDPNPKPPPRYQPKFGPITRPPRPPPGAEKEGLVRRTGAGFTTHRRPPEKKAAYQKMGRRF